MRRRIRFYEILRNGRKRPKCYFEFEIVGPGSGFLPKRGQEIPPGDISSDWEEFDLRKGVIKDVEGDEQDHIVWVETTTFEENFRRFAERSNGKYREVHNP